MAQFPFDLKEGDRFAIVAVLNAQSDIASARTLSDGTVVLSELPGDLIDDFWKDSLGSIAVNVLHQCNLGLMRKTRSHRAEVLHSEQEELFRAIADVFWLLQLSGIVSYEGAVVLKGAVARGRTDLRAHEDIDHHFVVARGAKPTKISHERLANAASLALNWQKMLAQDDQFVRLKRGLNVLLDGLQQQFGQERLHACVRSLEALILPEIGKTK